MLDCRKAMEEYMKKITAVVMTFVFCFSLAMPAMADSQKSVGVGVGMLSGTSRLSSDGTGSAVHSTSSTKPAFDVNMLFHRKVMTWGVGLRSRSARSPVGDLKYNGVSILLGYYSNKDHSSKLGWHILGAIGGGSVSGVGSGYKVFNTASSAEVGAGLDVVLRRDEKGSNRRPAADVLSLDLRYDAFNALVARKNATAATKTQLLQSGGMGMAMTFTHYFAWK